MYWNVIKTALCIAVAVPVLLLGLLSKSATVQQHAVTHHQVVTARIVSPNLCGYETSECPG